jgi:hypothetical protein
MHNESLNDPQPEPQPEPVKPSKMARIKSAAVMTGIFVIPTVVTAGASIVAYKTGKMNFDAAKLNLEAAKLAAGIANQS